MPRGGAKKRQAMYTGGPPPVKMPPSRSSHVVVRQSAGDPAPRPMAARKKAAKKTAKKGAKKVARKSASSSVPGISRIDQESTRTHGYFVRVGYHRTKEGAWRPKHRAFFGDASHGGKEKAFKAAVKWLKSKQS